MFSCDIYLVYEGFFKKEHKLREQAYAQNFGSLITNMTVGPVVKYITSSATRKSKSFIDPGM